MMLSNDPIHAANRTGPKEWDVEAIETPRYPDGMPMVKSTMRPSQVMLRSPHIGQLMTMLWWVDALRARDSAVYTLYIPLVPGVRQDRLQPAGGDQLFTLKSVAQEINARQFEQVVILDPHSDVAPALIDRCEVRSAAECLAILEGSLPYDCVIAPDAGALKRAQSVASMLSVPLVHAWKTRDQKTGALAGFGFEYLPPFVKRALIVDDLCDGGGTFVGLGEAIKKIHPKVSLDLYVTHGLFTQGLDKLLTIFDRIITTDSVPAFAIPLNNPKVVRLPVCERLIGATS